MMVFLGERFRRIWREEKGNVLILVGLALVVLIIAVGSAIDMARAQTLDARLAAALDEAGLAAGATYNTIDPQSQAIRYFNANYQQGGIESQASVVPSLTSSSDGSQLALSATTVQNTMILPIAGINTVTMTANSQITRAALGEEIVLVLDNTGSMNSPASDTDTTSKIAALKTASQNLLNILFGTQDSIPGVWVGLVPFTADVNVGTGHPTWMDSITSYNSGLDFGPVVGSGFTCTPYKDPSSGITYPGTFSSPGYNNTCTYTLPSGKTPFFGSLNWYGCVMSRPSPYDVAEDAPTPGNQPTLFAEYMAGANSYNPWITNTVSGGSSTTAYSYLSNSIPDTVGKGPNERCGAPLIPLTASKTTVMNGITPMIANGSTQLITGMEWGWHLLSPLWRGTWGGEMNANNLPQDYTTPYLTKVVIFMTDGDNYTDPGYYSSYGYISPNSSPNAMAPAGVPLNIPDFSGFNSALDSKFSAMCTAMKAEGIVIYTVGFGVTNSGDPGVDGVNTALLQSCATDAAHYFYAPNAAILQKDFAQIADSLQNLRVSK